MSNYAHDSMKLLDLYHELSYAECGYYGAADCNDRQGMEDYQCEIDSIQEEINTINESYNA